MHRVWLILRIYFSIYAICFERIVINVLFGFHVRNLKYYNGKRLHFTLINFPLTQKPKPMKKAQSGDKLLSRKNKTEVVEFLLLPYTKIYILLIEPISPHRAGAWLQCLKKIRTQYCWPCRFWEARKINILCPSL